MSNFKPVYITSRNGTHLMHQAFAESVNCDFQVVDHHIPWHGNDAPKWKRYLSWVVCPFLFPNKKLYHYFINSGPQFPQVFMKKWRLLKKNQKIFVLLDNESLFFLNTNYFNRITSVSTKWALQQYDGYICVGDYMTDLLHSTIQVNPEKVVTVFNGLDDKIADRLLPMTPALNNFNICYIANVFTGWRRDYKGFDLLLEAFQLSRKKIPQLTLSCVGIISEEVLDEVKNHPEKIENVTFVGKTDQIQKYLRQSSLYIQPSVGESWGIAVLEAMAAGIPTLVTKTIGVMEVVKKIDPDMVVAPQSEDIATGIIQYFGQSESRKKEISEIGKEISKQYTFSKATAKFKSVVNKLYSGQIA